MKVFLAITACLLAACQQERSADATREPATVPDSVYAQKGDAIISQTFDTLRQSLLSAVQSGGFPNAISFCNEKALSLMDVYADSAKIRRTALKYRNQENKPDSLELTVLQRWESEIAAGKTLSSRIVRENGSIHYFKPIHMQAMCLNCHGSTSKNIQPATLSVIRDKYPQDLAIDFEEGDLRGAWHLNFNVDKIE